MVALGSGKGETSVAMIVITKDDVNEYRSGAGTSPRLLFIVSRGSYGDYIFY